MKNKKYLFIIPILVSIIAPVVILAQTPTTQKTFYLGTNPVGILDDFNYTNGQQISYDITGYPPITITVHKWNDLTSIQKAQLTVRLESMGYIEGEETLEDVVSVIQ